MYHTVYNSYETKPNGRDYIGKHSTDDPYDDYKGSFADKEFDPDSKIVFAYAKTAEGALWLEIQFQKVFNVVEDPQFANRTYQTSTGFYYAKVTPEHSRAISKAGAGNTRAAKPIILIHPNGAEEQFESAAAACREYGLAPGTLSPCLTNKRKHHKGFTARFQG